MATNDMASTPRGIRYPTNPTQFASSDWWRTLAQTANSAIATAEAAANYVKGTIDSSTDLDSLADGVYKPQFVRTASELGIPVPSTGTAGLGELWVSRAYSSEDYKILKWRGLLGETLVLRKTPDGWTGWEPSHPHAGILTVEHDLDVLVDDSDWVPASSTVAAALGIPVPGGPLGGVGRLQVRRTYDQTNQLMSAYVAQTWEMFEGGSLRRVRWADQWTAWLPSADMSDDMAMRHEGLKNEFVRHYGTVDTRGRAAVALRFDHGLTNFKATILPLLRARGLTGTVAMNSRTWDIPENSGATPSEADSWDDIEFANHSATHQDAPSYAEQVDEIVNGRNELAAQLPNHRIDGWFVPGVGGTQYGGFGTGTRATDFADSTAGRLILGHHAWSSGHIAGTKHRKLDGVIRSGEEHYTIENKTVSQITSEIDAAISRSAGLSLMMHPRVLDTPGYLTTAQLTQVLDYIAAKRDAGDLVNLTLSEMMVADSGDLVRIDTTAGNRVFVSDVMVAGATGKRNMAGSLLDGWRVGAKGISLSRSDDLVTAAIDVVRTADGGAFANILDLPAGFVPATSGRIAPAFISITLQGWIDNLELTRLRIRDLPGSLTDGDRLTTTVMWTTRDPWPTTLPGTPA